MLQIVLRKTMDEQGLSSHKAAEAIGVSHTTILRALRGEAVDVDTIIKIANFVNVRPSELLNSMATDATLTDQLATLLSHSRELQDTLRDALERVNAKALDPAILRDIVSYALFKINQPGVNSNDANQDKSGDKRASGVTQSNVS
jgi:transcriptional regulator with XRE-family HTH domain